MTDPTPPPPPRRGRHQARTRWVVAGIGVAALLGAAILGTATARRQPVHPGGSPATAPARSALARDRRGVSPLRGVPLNTATGLRLLVANDPAPFLFDVDRGTAQPITGLPSDGDRVVWVLPVGDDAVVVSDRTCNGCRERRGLPGRSRQDRRDPAGRRPGRRGGRRRPGRVAAQPPGQDRLRAA